MIHMFTKQDCPGEPTDTFRIHAKITLKVERGVPTSVIAWFLSHRGLILDGLDDFKTFIRRRHRKT